MMKTEVYFDHITYVIFQVVNASKMAHHSSLTAPPDRLWVPYHNVIPLWILQVRVPLRILCSCCMSIKVPSSCHQRYSKFAETAVPCNMRPASRLEESGCVGQGRRQRPVTQVETAYSGFIRQFQNQGYDPAS